MTVLETDRVVGSSPKTYSAPIKTRVVKDMGGTESTSVSGFQETDKGQRVMIFRRRKGRRPGDTYIYHLGQWYQVTGVQPVSNNRTRDVVFMTPERPDGEIVQVLTVDGQPITAGGRKLVA